jgi:hypothetical protein
MGIKIETEQIAHAFLRIEKTAKAKIEDYGPS